MSTITAPSRFSKDVQSSKTVTDQQSNVPGAKYVDSKLESRLNTKDLEALQDAFMAEGDGYDNRLSLTREQFCEALTLILNKGTKEEFGDLFDKIDVTKEGVVDWDKFASHMLLEFYERDDRVKSTQVPQWKDLKNLSSPHKEVIQKIAFLKNTNRYIGISKEGCVSMWDTHLKLQRSLKTGTDSCRARDLWVTHFTHLHNVNKIALAFTSKEIAIYDLSTKLEFNCQYKVQGLDHTPLCLDYWSNPNNPNEAILTWGDTGGCVNALQFNSANIALFERPPAPAGEKQEPCLNVQLAHVAKKKYKSARYTKHQGHTEWVRQVIFSPHLECFISCATTWNNSLVIGWLEKHGAIIKDGMKTHDPKPSVPTKEVIRSTQFQISQGVNAFDYHEQLNLIASAGVNHHVCLWNPYVVSKPNGVLRGHMAAVVQVQFNKSRGQLISFSKDKVLRIWDVQLQVCIQRLAGMFPKGPEVSCTLYYDDRTMRLFVTFNYQLTVLEMKPEIKDRVMSHDKPVVAALYNSTYNQVVSACQGGTIIIWMIDTGQKVKQFTNTHANAEITCIAQDLNETRIYTGSTDGTVKIWDFNGHCYHTLQCGFNGQPADVGQILVLKRTVLVVGWAKYVTVFRDQTFKEFHVLPSDWKGGQSHSDDILGLAFSGPNTLVSGSYDGEIVVWNNSSEQASKHITQRCRKQIQKGKTFLTSREPTNINSEGGFDSHNYQPERPRTRPKSRTASRISMGSTDENNEYGFAISRMLFLDTRKGNSAGGGANMVTCGGNGWVRFWNTEHACLVAEYVAHTQVGSVIMAVDPSNHYLVTGDVDGLVKVWDIAEYCVKMPDEKPLKEAPPLVCQFQPHLDMINTLELCERNDRVLIVSASSDCSVAVWDIHGNQIGVFGQEEHWKIEKLVPQTEENGDGSEQGTEERPQTVEVEDELQEFRDDIKSDADTEWEPDPRVTDDPGHFRVNTWEKTHLGKDYQELRVKKRERKQPGVIEDLPYLHWERTGQPPAGPFAALDISQLDEPGSLQKPHFISHPHKYFSQRSDSAGQTRKLPALAETLKTAFDEKTLFPKYILDYEVKLKQSQTKSLQETQKKAGQNILKNVLGKESSPQPSSRTANQSPSKRSYTKKLKPLSVRSGSVKGD